MDFFFVKNRRNRKNDEIKKKKNYINEELQLRFEVYIKIKKF